MSNKESDHSGISIVDRYAIEKYILAQLKDNSIHDYLYFSPFVGCFSGNKFWSEFISAVKFRRQHDLKFDLTIVCRSWNACGDPNEEKDRSKQVQALAIDELLNLGVKIILNDRLHTKIYKSSKELIICSMNLNHRDSYYGYKRPSYELGLVVDCRNSLYNEILDLVNFQLSLFNEDYNLPDDQVDINKKVRAFIENKSKHCVICGEFISDNYNGSLDGVEKYKDLLCEKCLPTIYRSKHINISTPISYCYNCGKKIEKEQWLNRPLCNECYYGDFFDNTSLKNYL